jgi:hypothetical protein
MLKKLLPGVDFSFFPSLAKEPFFILRAQDCLAADLVLEWAKRAEGAGCPSDIVADARMQSRAMRQWPKKKIPD